MCSVRRQRPALLRLTVRRLTGKWAVRPRYGAARLGNRFLGSAEKEFAMLGELEWIRWKLDRLAAARLLGGLSAQLENEYDELSCRERQLMQAENRAAN